jgi:preprotein translocase subunit SecG
VLSRATTILAALFMVTSLALTMLRPSDSSFLDDVEAPVASPAPGAAASVAPPVTTAPAAPAAVPAASPAP